MTLEGRWTPLLLSIWFDTQKRLYSSGHAYTSEASGSSDSVFSLAGGEV